MNKIFQYSFFTLVGLVTLIALFFSIRQGLANAQVKREGQVVPGLVPSLETTSQLEIIPLYEEASADEDFDFGHGVSYLLRTDSATLLLDKGWLRNDRRKNEYPQYSQISQCSQGRVEQC